MEELEKTYLVKYLPDLTNCSKKEIVDIYIPKEFNHPKIRIRKNGNKFEITKKEPIDNNKSHQNEQTISLNEKEFEAIKQIEGKKVRKIRYDYNYNGCDCEIDVFQDDLKGLVLADFEFDNKEELEKFEKPDFCLADVSNELFIAGGMLCGKSYEDIEGELNKFNYTKK